jgi:hypothetical protein
MVAPQLYRLRAQAANISPIFRWHQKKSSRCEQRQPQPHDRLRFGSRKTDDDMFLFVLVPPLATFLSFVTLVAFLENDGPAFG